jgi:DNA-directed RNA polymerase subunit RPC12/RpoP
MKNGWSERMVLTMNRKKWELPRCPYCGKKLGFWESWLLRTQGEYTCAKCSRSSNIKFQRVVYSMAAIVSVLGLGILLLSRLILQERFLWGALLVALPFLLFALLSPSWMYLEAIKAAPRQDPAGNPSRGAYRGGSAQRPGGRPPVRTSQQPRPVSGAPATGQTIVMPPVGRQSGPRPSQPGAPGYRDAAGRPAQRPQGHSPRPQQPRQGGVRPPMPQNLRHTPPIPGQRQERAFVPPPKKSSQPPRPDAQSILDGLARRGDDPREPRR